MAEWRVSEFDEVRELGRGGQGRVVLARHRAAGTPVAIKYLTAGAGERARDRFRQEARMLGQVDNPHVARLYRLVESEQGTAIIMEAVDGVSFKEILGRYGRLEPEAALAALKGSLLGLAAAHAVGVVHGDYKPANVVVPAGGGSKLVDFGVAARAGETPGGGTPLYMAPEQWRGEGAGPAADVYAATCVFFESVAGRRPYGGDRVSLMGEHLTAPPPVDGLPEPLRPLVARGMAKEPGERPAGAAAFVGELERVAQAAYGAGWEARGLRGLAGAAAALAALFPLAAAGLSGLAGAGAGGSAAGVAGASGVAGVSGTAAKTGVLAGLGAKGTIAVAGTAVVAGTAGGLVVYDRVTGPERPPFRPVNVAFTTQTVGDARINLGSGPVRFAAVGGHRDPAVQRRINQALRAPVDEAVSLYRNHWNQIPDSSKRGDALGRPRPIDIRSRVVYKGPRLLSVGYLMNTPVYAGGGRAIYTRAVNVELATGRVLTANEIFRAGATAGGGLAGLSRRITPPPSGPECGYRPLAELAGSPGGAFKWASVALARDHLEVVFPASEQCQSFDYYKTINVPFGKVQDVMRPEALSLARATTSPR